MKIVCPHCGENGTVADSLIHQNIRCPHCKQILRAEVEIEFAPVEGTEESQAAPPRTPTRPSQPQAVSLQTTRPKMPQPQAQPQTAPPDMSEDQVPAGLALPERNPLCAGCGREAQDNEDFMPGPTGLLCPACRAAGKPVDNSIESAAMQPSIDWGAAAQAASDWRREDELREMAISGGQRAAEFSARFTVVPMLREAWEKMKGVKRHVLGAVVLIILINLIFAVIVHFLPGMKIKDGIIGLNAATVIAFFLNGLLMSGLAYLGLCQARGEKAGWDTVFVCFRPINVVRLLPLFILLPIIVVLGLLCLVVPGIYLAVTLSFSPLLVLDQGLGPWAAMRQSWRQSHGNCLNIFLIYLVAKVAFWAAVILLLIGLFWMLPFVFVLHGLLYQRLFDNA